ncbi:molybdopterin-dependent oxidoreductase [Desulfobulbus rhabdoformis]|uniref:molybdopterin-containing oxidoreductase family protein n=1 Tax=Desulfobulbus rhabdoformis TaxID=34032 RepID=UPI001964D99F|nr:molybdopterin-dependent oxidoreductase [Desulfobulbus rhabdoformis]MBM9616805.1 molybdopterin-dependent oxidoreductase [Desulfobulbus rhabdoformis]
MMTDTVCRFCSSCCPVEAEVENNRLVGARRKSFLDPDKRLSCAKLAAAAEIVYSPQRLLKPLIKKEDGAGFREAEWDEALGLVAEKFQQHKKENGAQSIGWLRGMAADWGAPWDYPNRLMNSFGSPNTIGNGSICFVARDFAHSYVYGSMAFPEAKGAKCIIIWGKNDGNTALGAAEGIHWAKEHGAHLVVIDPVETALARKADTWLQIKPGHDGLLAMAMINEIIGNGLYDAEFVETYCQGFDELKQVAAKYPAEEVAEQIWLTPQQIRDLAHLYATTKPAAIVDGNGLDMHREVFDTTRAIAMLRALTGNLDKPGSDVLPQPVPARNIQLADRLPADAQPITSEFALFNTFSETWGNQVQGCVVDAILNEKPYPLKMVVVQSGNPLVTMADSSRTREAFSKLETLVVIDMFMTETAKLADVILPASSCFEKTQLNRSSIRNNPLFLQDAVIEPIGDSWPDWKIVFELGRRLGLAEEFPWQSAEEAIDYQLEPAGVSVADLRKNGKGLRIEELRYEKYRDQPFKTPSGKIELFSERLHAAGFPGVPFADGFGPSPISFASQSVEYPLLGVSGSRDIRFTNSQYRTIPSLLNGGAGAVVDIHPEDAMAQGFSEGDRIGIETPKGFIEMTARLSKTVRPGMVRLAWGWGDYDQKANLNSLTEDDIRGAVSGTSTSRSFMCRLRRM